MRSSAILLLMAASLLTGCVKPYTCVNKCYHCQGLTGNLCSDNFPTWEVFNNYIADAEAQGYACTEITPSTSTTTKSKDVKVALEKSNYICHEK